MSCLSGWSLPLPVLILCSDTSSPNWTVKKAEVLGTHLSVHCAPLERQAVVGREVYRHLAPPEPEHTLNVDQDAAN